MNEPNNAPMSLRQTLYPLLQALWTEKLSASSPPAEDPHPPKEDNA